MNKLQTALLGVIAIVAGIMAFAPHQQKNPVLGLASQGTSFVSATDASSTCGQFTQGQISFGVSSTVSNATSATPFLLVINGTNVTSSALSTTTALSLANSFLTAIPSSTLGLSVRTSTDGTNIFITTTSTVWGAFQTINGTSTQNGISISTTTTGPATQILASIGNTNGGRGRLSFEATNYGTSSIYLCHNANCAINTGIFIPQVASSVYEKYSESNNYWGAYSCISNTSGTISNVSYTYSQF